MTRDRAAEKKAVCEWAYQTLVSRDFVVLDTETTDFPDRGGECLQLGIIDKFGNPLYNGLFNPKGKIASGAENIHHISKEKVADAPTWADEYSKISGILKDKLIIAYNASFDRPILENTCKAWGTPRLENEWDCAMLQYAIYYGDWNDYRGDYSWKKLTVAIEAFKLNVENAHDALGDVIMTLKVIQKLAGEIAPLIY